MRQIKRIGKILLDIFEIYIPIACYVFLFVTFILQTFYRYVLRNPIGWSYEMGLLTFVWTVIFGACYAWRDNEHIVFSLVYDSRSEMQKRVFDIVGSLMLFMLLALIVEPTWTYIFKQRRASSVLKISYKLMYFPFLIMVIISCGRQLYKIYTAVKSMISIKKIESKEAGS